MFMTLWLNTTINSSILTPLFNQTHFKSLINFREVATEPSMDLPISKLI